MVFLFVVLLVLKLAGVLNASWWVVTIPLWVNLAIIAACFVIVIAAWVWLFIIAAIWLSLKWIWNTLVY